MKFLALALLTILISFNAKASNKWTHFFYVAGDYSYQGPEYFGKKAPVKNQAELFYRSILDSAKADQNNAYILFYDPKGKGNIFNNKQVHILVYDRGLKLYSSGHSISETNQFDEINFVNLAKLANKYVNNFSASELSFYYYGEQFTRTERKGIDLSDKMLGFSFSKFVNSLQKMNLPRRLSFLFLQTCFVNDLNFIAQLAKFSESLLIAEGSVPNAHLDVAATYLKANSGEELKRNISSSFLKSPHPFKFIDSTLSRILELKSLVDSLMNFTETSKLNDELLQLKATKTNSGNEEDTGLIKNLFRFQDSGDAAMGSYDYIATMARFQKQETQILDRLSELFESDPETRKLIISF